jgi:hypothetical protein
VEMLSSTTQREQDVEGGGLTKRESEIFRCGGQTHEEAKSHDQHESTATKMKQRREWMR